MHRAIAMKAVPIFISVILCGVMQVTAKWVESYSGGELAGHRDPNRERIAGSSIGHLVNHKGKLYAANNYFMDSESAFVIGRKFGLGGQVLRKDDPTAAWTVDLDLGSGHLRCEILHSVTFTTDRNGRTMPQPVNLLVAATFRAGAAGKMEVSFFTRHDLTESWSRRTIFSAPRPKNPEHFSIRAILGHTDTVTGISMIFITLGVNGILSGVYNSLSHEIEWGSKPESTPVEQRPLAIIRANNKLYFSGGMKVYRRIDGPSPSYTVAHDAADLVSSQHPLSAWGGIRGMSPIPQPGRQAESIIFCIQTSSGNPADGCIYRLDMDNLTGNARSRTHEVCLSGDTGPVAKYMGGLSVTYTFAVYNGMVGFYPLSDSKSDPVHVLGLEAFVNGHKGVAVWGGKQGYGMYRGGVFCIRTLRGKNSTVAYNCNEVAGPNTYNKPPKVAVVTHILSPFEDEKGVVYFGGHDINPGYGIWSDNHAWITKGNLEGDVMPSLSADPLSASWPVLHWPVIVPSHGLHQVSDYTEDPFFDSTTGLEWMNGRDFDRLGASPLFCKPSEMIERCELPMYSAFQFCKMSNHRIREGKYSGERWRLPSISELRSFIRSCPKTSFVPSCAAKENTCNIDSEFKCGKRALAIHQRNRHCDGCRTHQGPDDGCYWGKRHAGRCAMYASSTIASDNSACAWALNQENGKVVCPGVNTHLDVRCVRGRFKYSTA